MLKDNKGLPATILTLHVMLSGCDSYLFLVAHAMMLRSRTLLLSDYSETTSEGTGGLDFE